MRCFCFFLILLFVTGQTPALTVVWSGCLVPWRSGRVMSFLSQTMTVNPSAAPKLFQQPRSDQRVVIGVLGRLTHALSALLNVERISWVTWPSSFQIAEGHNWEGNTSDTGIALPWVDSVSVGTARAHTNTARKNATCSVGLSRRMRTTAAIPMGTVVDSGAIRATRPSAGNTAMCQSASSRKVRTAYK